MNAILIFITCANKKEAESIAKALIRNKLAACVNILDKVKSFFCWQGKIDRADEVLLIVKSKKTKLSGIIKLVRAMHSYEVPEIIALPIIDGYKPYLRWIDESC
jgi:periplasmic divalent cation tolerance protein